MKVIIKSDARLTESEINLINNNHNSDFEDIDSCIDAPFECWSAGHFSKQKAQVLANKINKLNIKKIDSIFLVDGSQVGYPLLLVKNY